MLIWQLSFYDLFFWIFIEVKRTMNTNNANKTWTSYKTNESQNGIEHRFYTEIVADNTRNKKREDM